MDSEPDTIRPTLAGNPTSAKQEASSGLSLDAAIAALVAQSIAEVHGASDIKHVELTPAPEPAPKKPSIAERLGVSFHRSEAIKSAEPEDLMHAAMEAEAVPPSEPPIATPAPTFEETLPEAKLAPVKGSSFKQFKAVANRLSEARREQGDEPAPRLLDAPLQAPLADGAEAPMTEASEPFAGAEIPLPTTGTSMWGMATPEDDTFVRLPGVELAVAAAVEAAEAKTKAAPEGKAARHNVLRKLTSRIFSPSKLITPQAAAPANVPAPHAAPARAAFAEISPENLDALDAKAAPRTEPGQSPGIRATLAQVLPALPIILPVPVITLAAIFGDRFSLLALFVTLLIALAADDLIALGSKRNRSKAEGGGYGLEKVLGAVHFPVLALGIYALGGGTGLPLGAWFALFFALALYGAQVSGNIAHALIHAPDAKLRRLGHWIFVSFFYPHHAAAHRRIHHRFVATPDDPSTAEAGQGFWEYLPFAWAGTFIASYEIEKAVMPSRLGSRAGVIHPFVIWYGSALVITAVILAVFGLGAWLAYVLLCVLVQLQLLLADYVDHYGLMRARDTLGHVEPVRPQHAWAAPKILPAAWRPGRAHLPDHQANPARRSSIRHDRRSEIGGGRPAPTLPWPMSVMMLIAMVPPLWRRVMDPRLAAHEGRSYGDEPSGMQANIG